MMGTVRIPERQTLCLVPHDHAEVVLLLSPTARRHAPPESARCATACDCCLRTSRPADRLARPLPAAPLALLASTALAASSSPDVEATVKFPDDNPFGRESVMRLATRPVSSFRGEGPTAGRREVERARSVVARRWTAGRTLGTATMLFRCCRRSAGACDYHNKNSRPAPWTRRIVSLTGWLCSAGVSNGRSDNLLHVRVNNHAAEPITVTNVRAEYREASGKERKIRDVSLPYFPCIGDGADPCSFGRPPTSASASLSARTASRL